MKIDLSRGNKLANNQGHRFKGQDHIGFGLRIFSACNSTTISAIELKIAMRYTGNIKLNMLSKTIAQNVD